MPLAYKAFIAPAKTLGYISKKFFFLKNQCDKPNCTRNNLIVSSLKVPFTTTERRDVKRIT